MSFWCFSSFVGGAFGVLWVMKLLLMNLRTIFICCLSYSSKSFLIHIVLRWNCLIVYDQARQEFCQTFVSFLYNDLLGYWLMKAIFASFRGTKLDQLEIFVFAFGLFSKSLNHR